MSENFIKTIQLALFGLFFLGKTQAQAPPRCGIDFFRDRSSPPASQADLSSSVLQNRSVIVIPVVIHVVWNKQAENISNEQILSQIEVLNEDFRATNVEISGIPQVFKNKVADVEIEFCLADKDPIGNPTNGITRTFTQNSIGIGGTAALHYTSQGGKDAWDTKRYLNIWVCKFAGGIGGTASFPGEGLPAEDGVEIDYRQFGTINTPPPYHLGRTATHEIGHYLNLEHVWGPNITSCCEDDFIADTPAACETYLGECPTHPVQSCTEPDMFMNYMFYTDDACMGMFSLGQKNRMLATLNGFRSGLLTSNGCLPVVTNEPSTGDEVTIFQNPFSTSFSFEIMSDKQETRTARLYDLTGRLLFQKTLKTNELITWQTGGLPAGMFCLMIKDQEGNQRMIGKVVRIF
jgi:hypothetical protein